MSLLLAFELLVAAALVGVLTQTVLNLVAMPRLGRLAPPAPLGAPLVSVLIPARNEERTIARCLRAWARQEYADYEVLVFDDDSTDRTAERAVAAAAGLRRGRVLRGRGLPEGWRGKPYACHRLAREARGDILVFVDADLLPTPAALGSTVSALRALAADALSAVPRHVGRHPAVSALVALQNWASLAFVPAWRQRRAPGRVVVAMNGQFVAIRRDVYEGAGGFAAVRSALGEDVAFGRRLARLGYRVRLLDGSAVLTCEPYATLGEAWTANARNLLPVFFGSVPILVLALGLLGAVYLGPAGLLLVGALSGRAADPRWGWLPLAELALALGARWIADRRVGYPSWLALTHPLAVAAAIGIGVSSVIGFRWRREIEWRGRRYSVTDAA
ncbi:MAG TPA: glycosyltransferase family 2 protein [Methylomirabilota bacterium]|nr:glycosyltransferase family 2 protein [Methylomirabilota bacterium]